MKWFLLAVDARVVESQIEPAKRFYGICGQRLNIFNPGNIGAQKRRPAASLRDLSNHSIALLAIAIADDHGGAFARERRRRGPSYARPAAGDQSDLVLENHEDLISLA